MNDVIKPVQQKLGKVSKSKKKRPFAMNYRQYTGERGTKESWRTAFTDRIGLDKARLLLKDFNPRIILGLDINCQDWNLIKSAYRQLAIQMHPDKGGNHNDFIKIQGAYELLEEEFSKNK